MNVKTRILFYAQLGRLLDAGTPLQGALRFLEKHQEHAYGSLCGALGQAIESGKSLGEALKNEARLPPIHCRLLAFAEQAGRLPQTLSNIRRWDERELKFRRELTSKAIYPTFVLVAAIVLPPLAILVTNGLAAYLESVLFPLLIIGGAVAFLAVVNWAFPSLAATIGNQVPILSTIRRRAAGSTFLRALGMGLESGLGLVEALDGAAESAGSQELVRHGRRCRDDAMSGGFALDRLAVSRLFGDFGSQILRTGDVTGNLGDACLKAAALLEEDAGRMVKQAIGVGTALVYGTVALVVAITVIQFFRNLYSALPIP